MQEIAETTPAPTTEQMIELCEDSIVKAMGEETADSADADRFYILQECYRNYLYYRDLQSNTQLTANILSYSSGGPVAGIGAGGGNNQYDYTQNIYRGYARKLEAVIGNRMPNVTARPNNAGDPAAVSAVESANNAALYIREKCNLQSKNLNQAWGLFNFGTMFWHMEWRIDGDKYGYKPQQTVTQEDQPLGDASFTCPQCANAHPADPEAPQPPQSCQSCGAQMDETSYLPPTKVSVPNVTVEQIPKGGLEIDLHDATEVSVPLETRSIDAAQWLDWSRETHKGIVLKKWEKPDGSNPVRNAKFKDASGVTTTSDQYAETVRAGMISPMGAGRSKRPNYWTERDIWWTPAMYEVLDKKEIRQALKTNFPRGVRISMVKGKIVDMQDEKLSEHWQECKPEPSVRIMADPLGNDWIEPTDLINNMLNQRVETVERCNLPILADPRFFDFDAWQERQNMPEETFPVQKPAGGALSDVIWRPEPSHFSEQIGPFCTEIEDRTQAISGITPPIFGGQDLAPTARQSELQKNAALAQLGVIWTQVSRCFEAVYLKAVKLLAEREDGIIAFSKKNEFQEYTSLAIVIDDLRNGGYHFEADEAVPMTWGQQRDLMMWMLDKPAPLLQKWGFDDPLNIVEFKSLLGMPGERIPQFDNLKKGMSIITQLLNAQPLPGQPGPDGTPGPQQPSIQPDWEDDVAFSASLVKSYLQKNPGVKSDKPQGYANVILYGQACEAKANAPAPPPTPKTSVSLTLKGSDVGSQAVQDVLTKEGLLDSGTQVSPILPPLKPGDIPQNSGAPNVPGPPPPPIQ